MSLTIEWKINPNDESIKRMQKQMDDYINKEIIKQYLEGKFPSTFTKDSKIVFSTEAVFYFNSISDIIRVINKTGLTSDQVNIICADDKENKDKLSKIGHSIGKIPLKSPCPCSLSNSGLLNIRPVLISVIDSSPTQHHCRRA